MDDDRQEALIFDFLARLVKRTREGRVGWDMEGEGFVLRGDHGQVIVTSSRPQGQHPYALRVLNERGLSVYDFITEEGDFYTSHEKLIEDLYLSARGQYFDVEGTVLGLADDWNL